MKVGLKRCKKNLLQFKAARIESNPDSFLAFASSWALIVYTDGCQRCKFLIWQQHRKQCKCQTPPGFEICSSKQGPTERGAIDKTSFIKKDRRDIMLVQVYVDDIILLYQPSNGERLEIGSHDLLIQDQTVMLLVCLVKIQVHSKRLLIYNAVKRILNTVQLSGVDVNILDDDWITWQGKKQTIVANSSTEANMYSCRDVCARLSSWNATKTTWASEAVQGTDTYKVMLALSRKSDEAEEVNNFRRKKLLSKEGETEELDGRQLKVQLDRSFEKQSKSEEVAKKIQAEWEFQKEERKRLLSKDLIPNCGSENKKGICVRKEKQKDSQGKGKLQLLKNSPSRSLNRESLEESPDYRAPSIDSPDGQYLIIHREHNHFRAFDTLWEILQSIDRQDIISPDIELLITMYSTIPPTGLMLMHLVILTIIWGTAESSDR
ncbi:hypothetical protein Tco_1067879 [Tanacetum coccineum]|uniref:Reverse transcriptase Ty1/copia-type domain-containing protein n=1 Tax=Tanacetum coccineum TaxID=301880 RepID=A0ABQ5HE54_9ASTR